MALITWVLARPRMIVALGIGPPLAAIIAMPQLPVIIGGYWLLFVGGMWLAYGMWVWRGGSELSRAWAQDDSGHGAALACIPGFGLTIVAFGFAVIVSDATGRPGGWLRAIGFIVILAGIGGAVAGSVPFLYLRQGRAGVQWYYLPKWWGPRWYKEARARAHGVEQDECATLRRLFRSSPAKPVSLSAEAFDDLRTSKPDKSWTALWVEHPGFSPSAHGRSEFSLGGDIAVYRRGIVLSSSFETIPFDWPSTAIAIPWASLGAVRVEPNVPPSGGDSEHGPWRLTIETDNGPSVFALSRAKARRIAAGIRKAQRLRTAPDAI